MAVLFGYLVALTVLLSGGYLGLEWLASPDMATHVRSRKTPSPRSPNVSFNKPALREAEAKADTIPTSPSKPATAGITANRSNNSELAQGPGDLALSECKPIGLTADGQMVFPLECRELIGRQQQSSRSTGSKQAGKQDAGADHRGPIGKNVPAPSRLAEGADDLANQSDSTQRLGSKSPADRTGAGASSADSAQDITRKSVKFRSETGSQRMADNKKPDPDRSGRVAIISENFDLSAKQHRVASPNVSRGMEPPNEWYNPLGLR